VIFLRAFVFGFVPFVSSFVPFVIFLRALRG